MVRDSPQYCMSCIRVTGDSRIIEFGFEFEFELDFELDFELESELEYYKNTKAAEAVGVFFCYKLCDLGPAFVFKKHLPENRHVMTWNESGFNF